MDAANKSSRWAVRPTIKLERPPSVQKDVRLGANEKAVTARVTQNDRHAGHRSWTKTSDVNGGKVTAKAGWRTLYKDTASMDAASTFAHYRMNEKRRRQTAGTSGGRRGDNGKQGGGDNGEEQRRRQPRNAEATTAEERRGDNGGSNNGGSTAAAATAI
ncbi:hypothetical protein [Paenibacillus elgii]|uniref:hypothetical protein n=1 Tax=Paenibacillus elgii TaxID=189691 RepID=UPI0013D41E6C|nr:hypothetical protein [Paenibacillus elgii]